VKQEIHIHSDTLQGCRSSEKQLTYKTAK